MGCRYEHGADSPLCPRRAFSGPSRRHVERRLERRDVTGGNRCIFSSCAAISSSQPCPWRPAPLWPFWCLAMTASAVAADEHLLYVLNDAGHEVRPRRCERPDCITILCRYNPGPLCLIHGAQAAERQRLLELEEFAQVA